MGKARDLARVIVDSGGLISANNLGNAVPADGSITNAKIASMAASKLTGQVPDANAPSGSIVQVVSTTKKDSFQTTSSDWIDVPGFSVSITISTGRIYGSFSLHLDASSNNAVSGFRILRNGVPEGNGVGINGVTGAWNTFGSGSDAQQFTPSFLDEGLSPGTYTYKVQINRGSAGSISVNRFSNNDSFVGTNIAQSTLTLMEITQ